jgi:putative membrane protein
VLKDSVLARPLFLWAVVIVALVIIIAIVSSIWLTRVFNQNEESSQQARRDARAALLEKETRLPITSLPSLNAILNATSALLLGAGYVFIRRRRITAHKICMVSAVVVSALFLLSYVTYHYYAGSTTFSGQGWAHFIYLVVLIPHAALAVILIPFVIVVLRRGLKRRDGKHKWLAQRVLPLWFYTSVTGIIVYLMLYHLF